MPLLILPVGHIHPEGAGGLEALGLYTLSLFRESPPLSLFTELLSWLVPGKRCSPLQQHLLPLLLRHAFAHSLSQQGSGDEDGCAAQRLTQRTGHGLENHSADAVNTAPPMALQKLPDFLCFRVHDTPSASKVERSDLEGPRETGWGLTQGL